jgi:hypothetical protein
MSATMTRFTSHEGQMTYLVTIYTKSRGPQTFASTSRSEAWSLYMIAHRQGDAATIQSKPNYTEKETNYVYSY